MLHQASQSQNTYPKKNRFQSIDDAVEEEGYTLRAKDIASMTNEKYTRRKEWANFRETSVTTSDFNSKFLKEFAETKVDISKDANRHDESVKYCKVKYEDRINQKDLLVFSCDEIASNETDVEL